MFGYVEPCKAELKLWEYEQYRALYCGLCRSMGKQTGQFSRFALNYDFVFLAMIRTALNGETPEFYKGWCGVHPLKKRAVARDSATLRYAADVSALLTYYKVCDNLIDCRGIGRLAAVALKPFARLNLSRAKGARSVEAQVRTLLEVLMKLEADNASPDACAEGFGKLMAVLFEYGIENEKNARIAHEIGMHAGRFIYIADALDDFEDDVKSGSYNPFITHYGERVAEYSQGIMTGALLELESLGKAVELVDFSLCPGYGAAVRNIVYIGMPDKLQTIMKRQIYRNNNKAQSCENTQHKTENKSDE